jgi:hypothetical protein
MSRHGKLILAALLACAALGAAAGAASALRSFSVNETRYRLIGESLLITMETARISCAATITHTMARTIAKVVGTEAGKFTEIRLAGCRALEGSFGSVTFLGLAEAALWKFSYRSFAGTLPNITRISYRLNNILMLVEANFARCLFTGNGVYFWGFSGERDEDNDSMTLSRDLGGLLRCPATATVSGLFSIEPALVVNLI